MNKGQSTSILYIVTFAVVILGALGIWVGKSHFEATAFNAVTGKDVSTWQAMWIQLRVNENAD